MANQLWSNIISLLSHSYMWLLGKGVQENLLREGVNGNHRTCSDSACMASFSPPQAPWGCFYPQKQVSHPYWPFMSWFKHLSCRWPHFNAQYCHSVTWAHCAVHHCRLSLFRQTPKMQFLIFSFPLSRFPLHFDAFPSDFWKHFWVHR